MRPDAADQAAGLRVLCGSAGPPLVALHVVGRAPAAGRGTASAVLELALHAGSLTVLDGRGARGRNLAAAVRAASPATIRVALVDRQCAWQSLPAAHHLVLSEASARGLHDAFARFELLAQRDPARLVGGVFNARNRDDAQRFAEALARLLRQQLGLAPAWLGQLEAPGFGARLATWLCVASPGRGPEA